MSALKLLDDLIVKLETNLGVPHKFASPPPVATPAAPVAAPVKEEAKVFKNQTKKVKKPKKPKAPKEEKKSEENTVDLFYNLDIRVGKFVEVWTHPNSDYLYCEKIDIGEPEPRTIASGL